MAFKCRPRPTNGERCDRAHKFFLPVRFRLLQLLRCEACRAQQMRFLFVVVGLHELFFGDDLPLFIVLCSSSGGGGIILLCCVRAKPSSIGRNSLQPKNSRVELPRQDSGVRLLHQRRLLPASIRPSGKSFSESRNCLLVHNCKSY